VSPGEELALGKEENATESGNPLSDRKKDAMNTTAPNPADADLADVARVLAGDVGAFEGIVRRWQGPIINMAWRYCRDRGRAEELAQEAFVRAWRGLSTWRRESSFSTWLFALAANLFRNDLKRFPAVNLPIDDIAEPSRAADQLNQVEERFRNEVVRRAVLALPKRYREPVVLFYFHDQDVAAAARTMGLPDGTVKARLARARALLRRRFPQLEKEHADMAMAITGKEA
jgi:RNA polymerase sigma-70 factor (ECF subfamily)